jgi:hypothetical protein
MQQMVSNYTCKRSTRRWLLAIWSNIMDVAALNAYRIFAIQHLTVTKTFFQRNQFFKELAKELVMPYMTERAAKCKQLTSHTRDCMKRKA